MESKIDKEIQSIYNSEKEDHTDYDDFELAE